MTKFSKAIQFFRDVGDKEKNTSSGEWLLVLLGLVVAAVIIVWQFPASPMYLGGEELSLIHI